MCVSLLKFIAKTPQLSPCKIYSVTSEKTGRSNKQSETFLSEGFWRSTGQLKRVLWKMVTERAEAGVQFEQATENPILIRMQLTLKTL